MNEKNQLSFEILCALLYQYNMRIEFPLLDGLHVEQMVETTCYRALQKIREMIHNESLTDAECFQQIEAVICVLEDAGSSGGFRHDF